tara:strand:+ start:345 stop:482 length:138 start_codon:yes stop_codon:yes gene_type:complete
MPYKILKSGKGFKLKNTNTNKNTSKKPMTKSSAKKQLNLLNKKYK